MIQWSIVVSLLIIIIILNNDKTVISTGFRMIWRITQISQIVILTASSICGGVGNLHASFTSWVGWVRTLIKNGPIAAGVPVAPLYMLTSELTVNMLIYIVKRANLLSSHPWLHPLSSFFIILQIILSLIQLLLISHFHSEQALGLRSCLHFSV